MSRGRTSSPGTLGLIILLILYECNLYIIENCASSYYLFELRILCSFHESII